MKNFDDSEHEIVFSERFEDGAVLHRFINGGGVPYSAIYYGGYEAVSNKREEERDMIDYYREFHVPMRLEEQKKGKLADWWDWDVPAAFAAFAKVFGNPAGMMSFLRKHPPRHKGTDAVD